MSDFLDEDPAADFLAREQQDLANLEDDDLTSLAHNRNNTAETHDSIPHEQNDDAEDFNGNWSDDQQAAQQSTFQTPIRIPEPESEKVAAWKVEFRNRLEEMDQKEAKRKVEMEKEAKKELEDWYKHHEEQQDKRRTMNREHETSVLAERDAAEPGGEWERVCRLCEFNPKNLKAATIPAGTKDTSRMRSILLQLKQDPLVR